MNDLSVMFESCPSVVPIGENFWLLTEDFYFQVDELYIRIEKGFKTDFATIPHIFWSIESPYEIKTMVPAIIHDFLYTYNYSFDRLQADTIFYNALIRNEVPKWKALMFYYAVRTFGASHFVES